MRISYISCHSRIPSRDANSVHLMKMCSSYAKLGHKVTLYVSEKNEKGLMISNNVFEHYGVEENFKIRRVYLPDNRIGSFISMTIITPLLVFFSSPDLVHTRSIAFAWGATKFFRLPVILELHDAPDRNARTFKMYKEFIVSKTKKGIVVITKALSNYLKSINSTNAAILIEPDGVDDATLFSEFSKTQYKQLLGFTESSRKIAIYTGHLYSGRGIELIVDIAPKLTNYDFYIIGGNNSDVEYWKQKTVHLKNIFYLGFKPPSEIYKFQRLADVLLMPYANEVKTVGDKGINTALFASPLKMFEYMTTGNPIVSSKLPVLEEILEDNHNAVMLDYNNPNDWVKAIQKLDNDVDYGNLLGKNAFDDVKQYTWQKRAQRIIDFFT